MSRIRQRSVRHLLVDDDLDRLAKRAGGGVSARDRSSSWRPEATGLQGGTAVGVRRAGRTTRLKNVRIRCKLEKEIGMITGGLETRESIVRWRGARRRKDGPGTMAVSGMDGLVLWYSFESISAVATQTRWSPASRDTVRRAQITQQITQSNNSRPFCPSILVSSLRLLVCPAREEKKRQ